MSNSDLKFSSKFYFSDTPFHLLMKNRLMNVLLVCSLYDSFMLEEDGRIDEQLFNEYSQLSLRYPPLIIKASSSKMAFELLEKRYFDLIITMLNVGDTDAFQLAQKIKEKYPNKPIVVLTHFSREVELKLQSENLKSIDYVFSWLGNANILLAIIKLIEDKQNIEHDVKKVGVQTIILVEDSIRYYSSYLPALYTILIRGARGLMDEGLNEHQKTTRMRGRPKILLASNYEEAISLFDQYKDNIQGIISDITYQREGKIDTRAGLKLCEYIRNYSQDIPILLQSSNIEQKEEVEAKKAGFIYKHSKNILNELKDYIVDNFGFGDFVFKAPDTNEEVGRAKDLKELQKVLQVVPKEALTYHGSKNHISTWLRNRAFFSLANLFKPVQVTEDRIEEVRLFLIQNIKHYRRTKSRGIIAIFNKDKHDELTSFSRIGDGSLGGKARGLAFINYILKQNRINYQYDGIVVAIPQTVVLTTDVFSEFMEINQLYDIALSDAEDELILYHFINAELPPKLTNNLDALVNVFKKPIAIRSSSLLEDSHYQPFAGVYSTFMISNNHEDKEVRLKELCQAIKCVYASTFFQASKSYMQVTSNLIDEEKMAVILQEVSGTQYDDTFHPTFSGVARSINFYPVGKEKTEEGVVNLAAGLGKTIVEGETSLMVSPNHPNNVLQLSTVELALKGTQTKFYSLNMAPNSFIPSTDEGKNLLKRSIQEANKNESFSMIASTYDHQNEVMRDNFYLPGSKVITFSHILKGITFPLLAIIKDLLKIIETSLNKPVEIEFAVNLDTRDISKMFHMLQVRPIVSGMESDDIDLDDADKENAIVLSNSSLGNGIIDNINDFIYIKPGSFDKTKTLEMVPLINNLNKQFLERGENYILCGPGRWGSKDQFLGVPVQWGQISAARVIIESGLENFFIEPSQGSHFFQNLTSFRIAYFTIYPFKNDGFFDVEYLDQFEAVYEDQYFRHVHFEKPVSVKIDGKKSKAVIYKPDL
ncbi:MAG: phosphoenolpyruvate synthase [Deltaproteobacteria bacterium]|jgi:CheY-like chemotaxis protein|nr:phosphoenolpyruvate synthase [Deltaproteobacteria bacterium]